jgi:hypothetical protein
MVKVAFTDKEFRRLLDMVYIGNWVLNSARGDDRFEDYDDLESKLFSECAHCGMDSLYEVEDGVVLPSVAFEEGGIHEAIMDYEDSVFFEILAEELAARDMEATGQDPDGEPEELNTRIDDYLDEFDDTGLDHIIFQK